MKTRIAIVDDHGLIRESLAFYITDRSNYEVVMQASTGDEFIKHLTDTPEEMHPVIVLMDLGMPGISGIEVAEWMRDNTPRIKVLILTMMYSDSAVLAAFRVGVAGYVMKDASPDEFISAIDVILKNGKYYDPRINEQFFSLLSQKEAAVNRKEKDLWRSLSKQERQFVKLAATEKTYNQIAKEMAVAVSVVENLRQALFTKFRVKTRVGLALLAQRNNFLDNQ